MTRAMIAGGDAGRAGRAEVDEVVAALGERLDDRRQARHADLQARRRTGCRPRRPRSGGGRRSRSVPTTSTSKPGHAALAELVERVRDAVHAADAVGDERDAQRLAVAVGELRLLAAEEGRGRRVGDRREAGVEERRRPRRRCPRRRALPRRSASTALASLRSWQRRARRKRSACEKSSCCRQREQLGLGRGRARPTPARRAAARGRRPGRGRCRSRRCGRRPRVMSRWTIVEDRRGVGRGAVARRRGRARGSRAPSRRASTSRRCPARRAARGVAEHDVVEELRQRRARAASR